MAIYFKKYQNKNGQNNGFGKWYGRVVNMGTVEIEELATLMQDNCTVKRADILAVLSELGPTMKQVVQSSRRVRIPYLGCFKLAISTEGAFEKEKLTAKSVKKIRVLFQPTGKRPEKLLVSGCQIEDFAQYAESKPKASNTGEGSGEEQPATEVNG